MRSMVEGASNSPRRCRHRKSYCERRPSHRASARSPLPAIAGRDEVEDAHRVARTGFYFVIARSGATKQSRIFIAGLDCFAEPVIGPATSGRTRWLAITRVRRPAKRSRGG
jgi:hypothetical protein